ncbi:MAG: ribose-phosphate pyrophosphokinase [Methylacidiphilales bacterium]|nr:ribose-phosphate pyrophosphokinase [Candidatus Methylacidiphilales bacterium]
MVKDELDLRLFCGNSNPILSEGIANKLGIPMGRAVVDTFSDGEVQVEIEEDVRGRDVFVVQSTCTPVNDMLMELLILCDALRRSSAGRITAVLPYFGYARQDRRVRSVRVPITAKLVANMLVSSGVNRILTVDLHADQIQGFFDIPVDNVYASPLLVAEMWRSKLPNLILVSPDVGGVVRTRAIAKGIGAEIAIIDKRRERANVSEVMNVIGDVEGKNCIIVDDIVDTAGTLCNAASALLENGATSVYAYITHAVLSGRAYENIESSVIRDLVVTDTIPINKNQSKKIRQISVAELLAESIRRVHLNQSVSSLFFS